MLLTFLVRILHCVETLILYLFWRKTTLKDTLAKLQKFSLLPKTAFSMFPILGTNIWYMCVYVLVYVLVRTDDCIHQESIRYCTILYQPVHCKHFCHTLLTLSYYVICTFSIKMHGCKNFENHMDFSLKIVHTII